MTKIAKKTIQEAQRLVKNAFIRISMSLYYKAEKPGDYIEVYRVDNDEFESPHDAFSWQSNKEFNKFNKDVKPTNMPDPQDDLFDNDEKLNLNSGSYETYFFGFKDLSQHDRWFTKQQIKAYQVDGFKLRKYKASEVRDSSNQVMFIPLGGSLENARS